MGSKDWFRRTTWTETDRSDFFARLKRSRGAFHKSQYLRIQAGHLQEIGTEPMLRAALELLDHVMTQFPDESQLSLAFTQRAQCLADLGDYDSAIAAFRESFRARRKAPNWHDSAYLHFGELLIGLGRRELYHEAIAVLNEFGGNEVFPVERYQAAAIRALIAEETGDRASATQFARAAIEAAGATESPFRYHRKLGLVRFVDPVIIARLSELAAQR